MGEPQRSFVEGARFVAQNGKAEMYSVGIKRCQALDADVWAVLGQPARGADFRVRG